MRVHSFGRWILCAALMAAMLGVSAASAAAATSTCRASAVRVTVLGVVVEPVVAGGSPCPTASAGVGPIVLPAGLGSVSLLPSSTRTYGVGHPVAETTVTNVVVSLPGLPVISANVLSSRAEAGACANGSPALSSSSQVLGLKIGGTSYTISGPRTISLGLLGSLALNQRTTSNGTITQRALVLQTVFGTSVVIAESRAGFINGNPCA